MSTWSGEPEQVATKVGKLICRELEIAAEAVTSQFDQQRETLGFLETVVAPVNDTPSHVFDFEISASREIDLRVLLDGDRATPLSLRFTGDTAFSPSGPVVLARETLRYKLNGAAEDVGRLEPVRRELKRCINDSYSNVIGSSALQLIPNERGTECILFRMPKARLLGIYDELGCRQFIELLVALDKLG